LASLNKEFSLISKSPEASILRKGLKIGGMGLNNTFARLHLFFKGDFTWEIVRNKKEETEIRLNAPLITGNQGEV